MQAFSLQSKINKALLLFFLSLYFQASAVYSIAEAAGSPTLLQNKEYFSSLTQTLADAEKSIYLSMYLFKIGKHKKNRANQFFRLLVAAKKRGVKVVVRLEKSNFNKRLNKANRLAAKRLIKAGIQVLWDSPKRQSHSKLIIIDEERIYIGSHNLSHSALAKNQELSVTFKDKKMSKELLQIYFQKK